MSRFRPLPSVGRPNVGKSTLINRLLGSERMITSAEPGTTRDSVDVMCERAGQRYLLIDTGRHSTARESQRYDREVQRRAELAGHRERWRRDLAASTREKA